MSVTELPRPTGDPVAEQALRWIPVRAGILNVWRYYDEVFEFHDGRLLLRGPNGSGKSKALELLLPFLFDANLRANRLSTFGTGERSMYWNMMGEGASGITRVGYVWLEFGVRDEPGRWFTCGARLQASTHTTTVHPDYFTTDMRIATETDCPGPEFMALTVEGRPLTKSALEERFGERGDVYDNAGSYRDAVRSTLFPGLTEQRYEALITALLQLRTPKLSQRLDPGLLSTLLSKALPPLGHDEIADLAEGFERLDAQRERLARLDQEVEATRVLARQQRTYAQRVLRAGAAGLLSAVSEVDKLSAVAKQSADDFDRVERQIGECEARIGSYDTERVEGESRREGLMESEAYKQGAQLDPLRQETRRAEVRAGETREYADTSREQADRDAERYQEAVDAAERQRRTAEGCAVEAAQAASRVAMKSVYEELSAAPDDGGRSLLRGAVKGRRTQVAAMAQALSTHAQCVAMREHAEEELETARGAYILAADGLAAAQSVRAESLESLRNRLRDWASECRQLVFADPEELVECAESEPAVLELVNAAALRVLGDIARQEARCESDKATADNERSVLVSDRDRLLGEEDIPPTPPPWRTADRMHRPGAPLWRLVEFAPGVSESTQAGAEAALEASGMLDAWIGADGDISGHDVFADPTALAPVSGSSLLEVLVPQQEGAVDAQIVRRLLSAIGFGQGLPSGSVAAVAADGTWRLGNLTGSWTKEHPAYVGAVTRERARARRIRELDSLIDEIDRRLADLQVRVEALSARRAIVELERSARPPHDALHLAQSALTTAESEVRAADGVVRGRVDVLEIRERAVRTALLTMNELAADSGLPADQAALDRLGEALDAFASLADTWLDALGALRSLRYTADTRDEVRAKSEAEATERERQAVAADEEHRTLAAKLAEIEAAVGLDYREVLSRLDEVRSRIGELDDLLKAEQRRVTQLSGSRGELSARHKTDVAAHDKAVTERDQLAHRFRHLAAGTLAADSEIPDPGTFRTTLSGSEGVRAARDAARLVAAAWPTIPYANVAEAFTRLAASVHECRTTLAARTDLDFETDGDIQILTAVVEGVRIGAAELFTILRTEADQSKSEITDQEHRLFDRTLTGDTRRHLAARIRQANDLVDNMNTRLSQVRTASHVSVRLVWEIAPDLPSGTRAARDLLLKNPVMLSDTDRESLHRFLRDRIEAAKAADTAASWEQQLAEVFDYTAWHRFVVKVDRGKGEGWQVLTKKLHGALSGGEKAIALHLPLFAAVAAHYEAVPSAPRLILLDEVFVGVDTTNRGQIFALLTALNLDLMLTSDHEWCTYAELPGVGIHQILGGDGDDAVTTARFTWDGKQLQTAE